jgi:RNA polymerase sigma-70 factor (ECF subfamily)
MSSSCDGYGELLRRLSAGDLTARDKLIELAQERLRLRISQMLARFPTVHRYQATSDVLQEVLIDLSELLTRLTPRDVRHFLGLAGQHIRWKLLDLARRPTGAQCITDGGIFDAAGETTHDPVRLAQWAEIHAYIDELPAAERELFDLIFYQGVPQQCAANLLGISCRTLKRRWHDARLRFIDRFEGVPF